MVEKGEWMNENGDGPRVLGTLIPTKLLWGPLFLTHFKRDDQQIKPHKRDAIGITNSLLFLPKWSVYIYIDSKVQWAIIILNPVYYILLGYLYHVIVCQESLLDSVNLLTRQNQLYLYNKVWLDWVNVLVRVHFLPTHY